MILPDHSKQKYNIDVTQLIVNADDFGKSPWVNAAIIAGYRRGIITSTSLIVTGEGFDEAVRLARANPELRVGLHVTLLHSRPCLPPQAIPDLVDTRGRLPEDPIVAGLRWFLKPAAHQQIRREVRAQVERFLATGLALDHLNSHLHFHVHPVIFDALLSVADEVGVPAIRLPVEPAWPSLWLDRSELPRKLVYVALFGLLSRRHRPHLAKQGYAVIDGTLGLLQTGNITEEYLLGLLRRLPRGTYELYAHPRLDTAAGLRELAALTSPRVRQTIQARDIHLTTYSAT